MASPIRDGSFSELDFAPKPSLGMASYLLTCSDSHCAIVEFEDWRA